MLIKKHSLIAYEYFVLMKFKALTMKKEIPELHLMPAYKVALNTQANYIQDDSKIMVQILMSGTADYNNFSFI